MKKWNGIFTICRFYRIQYSLKVAFMHQNVWSIFLPSKVFIGCHRKFIQAFKSVLFKSNLEIILQKINYSVHYWMLCSDLKVVPLINSNESKIPCFLWEWNSRASDWPQKQRSSRKFLRRSINNFSGLQENSTY